MTTEDIKITADRQEVHLGEEFAVLIAPRELGRGDRVVEGVAYVIAVDDSYSMEIRADSSTDEFADPGNPDDPSRKQVAEAGVHELVAALPRDAHVDVLTFAQNAGVRFSGTAGSSGAAAGGTATSRTSAAGPTSRARCGARTSSSTGSGPPRAAWCCSATAYRTSARPTPDGSPPWPTTPPTANCTPM